MERKTKALQWFAANATQVQREVFAKLDGYCRIIYAMSVYSLNMNGKELF